MSAILETTVGVPAGYAIIDESAYNEFLKGVSLTDSPLAELVAGLEPEKLRSIGLHPETNLIEADGLLIDSETGEFVGVRPPDDLDGDKALAEWVLERIQSEEAAAEAVEQTQLVIQSRAILANAEKLKADRTRSAEYLRWKFLSLLKKVALENLPRGKKTWQTLSGSVAFRTAPEKVSVCDPEKAAAWLLDNEPGAVRIVANLDQMDSSGELADLRGALVELVLEAKAAAADAIEISPMISKLSPGARASLIAVNDRPVRTGADGKPVTLLGSTGFSFTPAGESVTIKTGVKDAS